MANWYVNSVAYSAVQTWSALTGGAATAVSVGVIVRQTSPAVGSERCFRCTTAGTTGTTEPTWTTTKGGATTDGSVHWTEVTGQETYQSPGSWTAPHARLANALASGWAAAGDNVYMSSNHAETQSSLLTLSGVATATSPIRIVCVDESASGHVPPQSGDLKTTATISTTGASGITLNGGYLYVRGVTLSAGSGSSSTASILISPSGQSILDSCGLVLAGTGASSKIGLGTTSANIPCGVILNNTTVKFGSTSQSIGLSPAKFSWRNTPSAIQGSTIPGVLFNASSALASTFVLEGVDLSALGSGSTLMGAQLANIVVTLKDCKINASATLFAATSGQAYDELILANADSSGTNYRVERYGYAGQQTTDTAVTRTSGAGNGAISYSWKVATTANSQWLFPFECLPIAQWNGTTGSSVPMYLRGIWNAAALPNNDDIWFDCEFLGSSGNPLGSFQSASKSNLLASNAAWSSDTSAWDVNVSPRQNSHAYSVGDTMTVGGGQVWFCTTAGTSAGSQPVGYTGGADGSSVTDGSAVFRAGVRFKMSITLSTPQLAGYLYAYLKAAKASSTFWVDPLIAAS